MRFSIAAISARDKLFPVLSSLLIQQSETFIVSSVASFQPD